jgi:hypothetical protein
MSKPDRANHPGRRPNFEGPSQLIKVTPTDKDADYHGVEAYEFGAPVGTTKKDIGKHIAGAIKVGFPKPDKVEFNK